MTDTAYWCWLLQERPELLALRSNDIHYEQWLKDHPGFAEVPMDAKQCLSNVKAMMRAQWVRKRRSR
jgi:hypothetical protein